MCNGWFAAVCSLANSGLYPKAVRLEWPEFLKSVQKYGSSQ